MNAYGLTNYWPIKANEDDYAGTAHMIYGANNSFCPDRYNNANSAINFANGFNTVPSGVYFSGDFTISLWISLNQIVSLTKIVEFSNNKSDLVSLYASSSKIGLIIGKGAVSMDTSFSQSLQTSQWYFFSVTFCETRARFYLDGNLKYTATQLVPNGIVRTTNYVGGNSFGNAKLNAKIDELRVYNRCLSQNEIMNLMNFENTSPDE